MTSPAQDQSSFSYLPNVRLTAYSFFFILVIFLFDISIPLGVAGAVPYTAVILISLWSPKRTLSLYLAAICSVLTILGFFVSPEGGETWKTVFNRSLVILAIWVVAVLTAQWKTIEQRYIRLRNDTEKEKQKIYLATMHGAQHIINNLLNELQLVKLEAEKQPDFDKNVMDYFDSMLDEASKLMQSLSAIEEMDEKIIRESVLPKNHNNESPD